MNSFLYLIVFHVSFLLHIGRVTLLSSQIDAEANMNVYETIKFHGYPLESHQVTTEDGYILTLQRIPLGLKNTSNSQRPVVLLQHGLLDSAFTWVNNGPKNSLAFILADKGFDVWLSNSRGNVYSRNHTTYSPSTSKFWDFTWDEMANYDLPAVINYALSVSKATKLGYIGHSQGTEIGFAKFSQNSNINAKVNAFVALAPVAYLGHLKTGIKYISGLSGGLNLFLNVFSNGEFLPNNDLINALSKLFCGDQVGSIFCANVAFLLQGFNVGNLNLTRMPIYVTHIPAGTSSKNIDHYSQSHLTNEFKMYDYGFFGNLGIYKQITPPKFTLNTYGVPVAMFYGGNDWMAVTEDVERAITELGDNVKLKKFIPEYNHLDFIWGANAATHVYPDIVDFLYKYV